MPVANRIFTLTVQVVETKMNGWAGVINLNDCRDVRFSITIGFSAGIELEAA